MSNQVASQIERGSLVALLRDYESEPVPVHMVFPSRKGVGSAVQAFIDHVTPLMRASFPERSENPPATDGA